MRITRGQLGRIIREEAMRLREAGIPIKQAREMYGTSDRAPHRASSRPQGGMNDKISAYNGEYFELVDAVRDLAEKMGVSLMSCAPMLPIRCVPHGRAEGEHR